MYSKMSLFSRGFSLVVLILQVYGISASIINSNGLAKRNQFNGLFERRQAQPAGAPQAGELKLSPEEESAIKLFELVIQMAGGLENVTSLATKPAEIAADAKKVTSFIPEIENLKKSLLEKIQNKDGKLDTASSNASQAAEKMAQSLTAIAEKAEDANLIKSHYPNLEDTFKILLFTTDEIVTAAVPKLAQEAAANGGNGAAPAQSKPAEANPAESKPAEGNPAESKPAEVNQAESKPAEVSPAEVKPAETQVQAEQ
ncbi:expressed protein [Phakopsora pachyrhizi]|uniref:Expressed protein n=1 Tax=Phakopsora pachyrhizi TaxID=170000 RepID=A0AAV0BWA7_PHAPC|nr:expressed protein [Phakopsora pachyrhizi]